MKFDSSLLRQTDLQHSFFGVTTIVGMDAIETWWREAMRLALWTMTVSNSGSPPAVSINHVRTIFDAILPAPLRQPLTDLLVTDALLHETTTTTYNYMQHLRYLIDDLVNCGDASVLEDGVRPAPVRLIQLPGEGVLVSGGLPTAFLPPAWLKNLRALGLVRQCAPLTLAAHLPFDAIVVPFDQWVTPLVSFPKPFWLKRGKLLAFFQSVALSAPALPSHQVTWEVFQPSATTVIGSCWVTPETVPDGRYVVRDSTGCSIATVTAHTLQAWHPLPETLVLPLLYALLPEGSVLAALHGVMCADGIRYVVEDDVPEPLWRYIMAVGIHRRGEWPKPLPFSCVLSLEQHAEVLGYCHRLGVNIAVSE